MATLIFNCQKTCFHFFNLKKSTGSDTSVSYPLTSLVMSALAAVDSCHADIILCTSSAFCSGASPMPQRWRPCLGPTAWAPRHQGWCSCCYYWMSGAEIIAEISMWCHMLRRQIDLLWQVDYIGPLLPWKEKCFVLSGIDTYSRYGFVFIIWSTSASITLWRLEKCRFTDMGSQVKLSDQGTYFMAMKIMRMDSWLSDPLILHIPYRSRKPKQRSPPKTLA